MANVSMDLVKELREKTQVGMMDCKKALMETNGDIEKAIELLRKKGAAVAAKRAENAMDNGRVECFVTDNGLSGAIAQIGCETDFSANTQDMKEFAQTVAKQATQHGITSVDQLLEKDDNINNHLNDLLAKISEKIQILNIAHFSMSGNGIVNAYIHPGSSVGVLVQLSTEGDASAHTEKLKQAAKDVCMHIAVTKPLCAGPDDLDPTILNKEKGIMEEQLKNSGKPDNIIEKIMIGKVNKYYEEVCLSKQKYIKNDKLSVEGYLQEVGKELGTNISIEGFARFGVGGK